MLRSTRSAHPQPASGPSLWPPLTADIVGHTTVKPVTVSSQSRGAGPADQVATVQSRQLAAPSQTTSSRCNDVIGNFPSDQREQARLGLVTRSLTTWSQPTLRQYLYALRHSPVKKGLENASYLVSAVHGGSRLPPVLRPSARLYQVSTVTGVLWLPVVLTWAGEVNVHAGDRGR